MNARHIDDRPDEGYSPTTTHAEFGAGNPLLRISRDGERSEFPLDADTVRIGSAEGNELQLADTDPVHATIEHDERDEYVLTMHGYGEMNSNPTADATHDGDATETLRTGARFTAGPWTLVFAREEFADHGRPFGGRKGGEFSDQPLQPPRPDYENGESPEAADEPQPEEANSTEGMQSNEPNAPDRGI
jgi:hypothetical protein